MGCPDGDPSKRAARHDARAGARLSAFLMLRTLAFLALVFGLVRIAAQYAGLPAYLGGALVIAAQAAWWALKR